MTEPIVLRPSELARYADCPNAWACNSSYAARHAPELAERPRKLHVAAAIGTGAHAGVEHACRQKLLGWTYNPSDCHDAGIAGYDRAVGEAGGIHAMIWDGTSRPQDAHGQVARIVKAWCGYRLAEIEPIEIERRVTIPLIEGIVLSGQMDQVLQLPDEVRDLKTGAREPAPQIQLGCYGILRKHVIGRPVTRLGFDFVERLPLSREQTPPRLVYYDAEACMSAAWRVINDVIETLGIEFLCNPTSKLCSRTYCAAHGTDYCPITRRIEA